MNTHATTEELPFARSTDLYNNRGIARKRCFLEAAAPRLYNQDLRQLRGELRESLEVAVEDDGEEKT
jgi:hypothetical protein